MPQPPPKPPRWRHRAFSSTPSEIQSLFARIPGGVPQSVLDSHAGSVARLGGTSAALTAQSARLTAMAVDPSNQVP